MKEKFGENRVIIIISGIFLILMVVALVVFAVNNNNTNVEVVNNDEYVTVEEFAGPYTVQIDITESSGAKSDAMVEVESETRSRTVVNSEGETIEFIIDGNDFYTWSKDTGWLKITDGGEQNAAFANTYSLSNEQVAELQSFSEYVGEQSCSSGTCKVYTGTFEGEQATVMLDKDSNRVISIESVNAEGETVLVVYTYDVDVKIDVPTDAIDISDQAPNG